VRGCHFTPDDRYLATCDNKGGVRVWAGLALFTTTLFCSQNPG
jgi:hypothetical protein